MNTSEPSTFAALLGGIDLTVSFADHTVVGAVVKVRQLPVKLFPAYLATMNNETAQVELLCDKPAGWAESLTRESHEAIIEAGDKLNADFFGRWLERKKKRKALLPKPEIGEVVSIIDALQKSNPGLLDELMKKASAGESSPSTSPTSPLPAG